MQNLQNQSKKRQENKGVIRKDQLTKTEEDAIGKDEVHQLRHTRRADIGTGTAKKVQYTL